VCLLAGAAFQAAPAVAACPNEVFRTGPSANLPECRAYELVTPADTGGAQIVSDPSAGAYHNFPYPLLHASGNSLIFALGGGALTGSPSPGLNDRYRAQRTAAGWTSEYIGPTAAQTTRPVPGGVSTDHQYYFLNAGFGDYELEPEATLEAPYGGKEANYLRKPNGEFELIAKGSLGSAPEANGRYISPGASHVIFTARTQLEPQAPPSGTETIYDRTPGGPTQVVSLLPGNVTPTEGFTAYQEASPDGTTVAFFQQPSEFSIENLHLYVRLDNSVTKEVARSNGVVVGKELTCEGSGSTSGSYQWLRNGAPIGGATSATYTAAAADQGKTLQCQVTASSGEGESIQASLPPVVVAPYEGKDPPYVRSPPVIVSTLHQGFAEVGEPLTCEPGAWEENPSYSYQWFRDGVEISGATGAVYIPVGADDGKALQCRLTATNVDGVAVGYSEPIPVHPAPPLASSEPLVANVTNPGNAPVAGDQLSCSDGSWTGTPTFSYQWLRNGAAIPGATAADYTVTFPADEAASLQCVVTASAAGGTVQAIAAPLVAEPQPGVTPPEAGAAAGTNVAAVEGSVEAGGGAYCNAGMWSGEPTISVQWLRDGAEIAGETDVFYVPTSADIGSLLQCRVSATNAGGTTVAVDAGAAYGARYVIPAVPFPSASLQSIGLTFAGIRGDQVFYVDRAGFFGQVDGDLYSYDIETGSTTRITGNLGDASFTYVSPDGSHVFFLSEKQIGGEGAAGESNLYVWARGDGSTHLIATVAPRDRDAAGLDYWAGSVGPSQANNAGPGLVHARSTPDGSVFLFETSARLTSFDNTEVNPEACGESYAGGQGCAELYVYDTTSQGLTCVSCPPLNPGPATGQASLASVSSPHHAPAHLTIDGSIVFFESTEDLLPQDTNERRDVYRWKRGDGLALISTGQSVVSSRIYAMTPTGSDIAFLTQERLLPEDHNEGSVRVYDARVNGGFPPPEDTVTEPCAGDACQGSSSAAPPVPNIGSSSLNGGGNLHPKLHCPKGKRRVVRHGKERCVKRKRHGHRRHHRRAGHKHESTR